jgi:hypothetical protein
LNIFSYSNFKNSIGIILLWIGPPLIYFLKGYSSLGSGSIFTGICYFFGILLMLNNTPIKVGYKPNLLLFQVGISFLLISIFYFIFYNGDKGSFNSEIINFVFLSLYLLFLLKAKNSIQGYLPIVILGFTLITNLALIYSISTNPAYVIGSRATVQFKSATGDFAGNPHMYSRNGLAGFIISILLIFKNDLTLWLKNNALIRLAAHANLWISLLVIVLTQTRVTFISLIIVMLSILIFVFPLKTFFKVTHWYVVGFYMSIFYYLNVLNNRYSFVELINNYFNSFLGLVYKALNTGLKLGKNDDVDDSAMGRVSNFNYFIELWNENPTNFLFGFGYRFRYIDIPVLESFINFGLIGFLLYLSFNIILLVYSIKAFKSNSIFQIFLGLFYLHTFLAIFSSGRPLDFTYWIAFLVYIRFLGVKDNDLNVTKN